MVSRLAFPTLLYPMIVTKMGTGRVIPAKQASLEPGEPKADI